MDKVREATIRDLRCCLVFAKEALEINRLAADYKTYTKQNIPLKQLGFENLEEFLQSVESFVVRKKTNGQILVEAKTLPHISNMAARQNTKHKKRSNITQDPKRWRPVDTMKKNYHYRNSPRLAQHNQFLTSCDRSYNNNNVINATPREKSKWSSEFVESGNIGKDLWNFTRFCRIAEPQITVMERKSKPNRPAQFDCKIKVDGESMSSFPDDCFDERSATQSASKKALEKLIKKYGRTRPQHIPVASESCVIERVPQFISKHFNGVWSWQVEADYKDVYQEVLPANWMKTLEEQSTHSIVIEQIGDKFILRACTPGINTKHTSMIISDVCVPTSTADFNEKGYMTAKITYTVSAGEIWYRQMDTHETTLFDVMQKQFNDSYNKQYEQKLIKSVGKIIEGNYYAAWKIDSGWHRVRALEVHQTDAMCLCLFVDIGEDCLINFGDIYALHMDFARVRAQAFACKLTGLDALFDVSQDSQAIRDLQGMDVTLEAVGGDDEEDAQKIFSVVMYDLETGQACNKDLMISIAVENATHHFETDKTYEVFVSHIGIKSMFYVQIRSAGYDAMLNLIKDLQGDLPQQQITITRENCIGKLYFAKLEDGCHRVRIIDSSPNFEYAQLLYVDVGTTKVIPINNTQLIPLETLSPALNKFPPQATLVSLHSESKLIVDDFVDKMKELLPQEQSILMRVQDIHENVPSVMLFIPNSNGLVSVNEQLYIEKTFITAEKLTPPDSPHNVPSAGVLQSPRLPNMREYFEVKIPFAVNPWNFFVQPLDSAQQLRDMMTRMQATFANRHTEPVNLKDVSAGNIYAAKHDDGKWCRVCVLKTIYPSAIVVFYVDYGYYANLGYQNLFALDKQFLELPYQAIKAKLAGVKPIQEKWSVDNCRYFENLVQQREYVSVIIAIEKDELYPCDNVLVLKLIDTKSSGKDVLIDDFLIRKKIAVKG